MVCDPLLHGAILENPSQRLHSLLEICPGNEKAVDPIGHGFKQKKAVGKPACGLPTASDHEPSECPGRPPQIAVIGITVIKH